MSTPHADYRQYEHSVRKILQSKMGEDLPGIDVKQNCRFLGLSGHEHQIDVSAEISLAGCRIHIVAECKHYDSVVGIEDVLVFSARVRDIGAHKGIMVTTVGFQKGATRIAKANGIALVLESGEVLQSDEAPSWEVLVPALLFGHFATTSDSKYLEDRRPQTEKADGPTRTLLVDSGGLLGDVMHRVIESSADSHVQFVPTLAAGILVVDSGFLPDILLILNVEERDELAYSAVSRVIAKIKEKNPFVQVIAMRHYDGDWTSRFALVGTCFFTLEGTDGFTKALVESIKQVRSFRSLVQQRASEAATAGRSATITT